MTLLLAEVKKPVIGNATKGRPPMHLRELVVFCPRCKALETFWFTKDTLMPTRKFNQENGHVFHDCGSGEPCRLYRTL